jgi:CRP-like cAMP-binding protein
MTLNLGRKDFAEVLYYHKQQMQVNWQKFILKIPFIASLPYHLVQDVSGMLYPQRFLHDEVVFDVGETNCDTLYFVESGKL